MGLADVVLPELDRFQREDKSWLAVAGELAYRTVEQHLQIAWSRLLADPKRDVALLTTDGDRWYSRDKTFAGGRTLSRLPQALGWLTDLRLLDSAGLTADGDDALHRALQVLAETRRE